MKSFLEMKALIAAEYHVYLPDDAPLYEFQFQASLAENRRNDRIKAAQNGQVYCG